MSLLFPRLAGQGGAAARPKTGLATVTVVAAAHVAVLLLLLSLVPAEQLAEMTRPLAVRLIELAPEVIQQPLPKTPPLQAIPPRHVLAVATPAPAPEPLVFAVPPQAAEPPAVPPAPTFTAPAPASITAARFDAAYLNNPKPVYPNASRRLGEEGKVVLRVHVDPDGRPGEIEIRSSSGFARLDAAAYEAVSRWRFVPARRGDEAMAAWVAVPITFNLEG
jgi:protein TonB